jgi:hypothetical protein
MRFASTMLVVAALAAPFALTQPARAQAGAATPWPKCDGTYTILRISEIKPGMMPKFIEAVAAQQAFYKHKGLVDQIILERVSEKMGGAYSETLAITDHILGASAPASRTTQDDEYKAFVALFAASSTIKTTYYTCQTK